MPHPRHGNFDFARFDPEPVDAHPAGVSAWGVEDLIGNGWEWTSSTVCAVRGLRADGISVSALLRRLFDDKHFVMKGASPVTAPARADPSVVPELVLRRAIRTCTQNSDW